MTVKLLRLFVMCQPKHTELNGNQREGKTPNQFEFSQIDLNVVLLSYLFTLIIPYLLFFVG